MLQIDCIEENDNGIIYVKVSGLDDVLHRALSNDISKPILQENYGIWLDTPSSGVDKRSCAIPDGSVPTFIAGSDSLTLNGLAMQIIAKVTEKPEFAGILTAYSGLRACTGVHHYDGVKGIKEGDTQFKAHKDFGMITVVYTIGADGLDPTDAAVTVH